MSITSAAAFTVPTDCFTSLPETYAICVPADISTPRCYWSIPSTCFPPDGETLTNPLNWMDLLGLDTSSEYQTSPTVVQTIGYTTDVLPSEFATIVTGTYPGDSTTVAQVCLTGWNTYDVWYCTSNVYAPISLTDPSIESTGPISVFMPQLHATFFSTSDPTTPTSTPTAAATPASEPTAAQTGSSGKMPSATALNTANPTPTADAGLSTGAQAGIGVGVAVVAIILCTIAILFFRRKRSKSRNMNGADRNSPYLDQKYELENSGIRRQEKATPELAGRNEMQELNSSGPPRETHELEGGFMGYEAGHAPGR